MNCYEVIVPVTNRNKKSFQMDGVYHDCEDGRVYVFADNAEGAAKQVPIAINIRLIGRAFGYSRVDVP